MQTEDLKEVNVIPDSCLNEGKSSLVLVVDDDLSLRKGLVHILRKEGYRTAEAADGRQAIEMIAVECPDLLLLDLMLPEMNGIEVCAAVKGNESTRLMPVIMITALHEQREKLRAIEAGCDDFLNKPINLVELRVRVKSLLRMKHLNDLLDRADTVILSLANAIEAKDKYCEGHNERISHYSLMLARAIGLSPKEQDIVKMAGILHDIGKIGVPDAILNKNGPLEKSEFETIFLHPVHGEKILKPLHSLKDVRDIVLYHHEWYNGGGYPEGLRGDEIPLLARIIAIADSYDAMTTTRPYREALEKQRAIEELRKHAGRMWDPELVEIFIEQIGTEG